MATYEEAGVNISEGDKASAIAYSAAKKTFDARKGMIGMPVVLEGGFAGALDFKDYYMVLGCDTVGTKIDIATSIDYYDGLGYDLLCMTADDLICVGAEVVAITNTVDTKKVNSVQVEKMMKSLLTACKEQKVVIPGGEIAESGEAVAHTIWDSTALGIVEKEKYITGEKVQEKDVVISLYEPGFRCNGYSLIRHICKNSKIQYKDDFGNGKTWGEMLLTPSSIYHAAVLHLLGRFGEERKVDIHGIAHITGGGLAGNLFRILKKGSFGADLPSIWEPSEMVKKIQKLGDVPDKEAYRAWSMGNGMLLVVAKEDAEKALSLLAEQNVEARIAGEITSTGVIRHTNLGAQGEEGMLEFQMEK